MQGASSSKQNLQSLRLQSFDLLRFQELKSASILLQARPQHVPGRPMQRKRFDHGKALQVLETSRPGDQRLWTGQGLLLPSSAYSSIYRLQQEPAQLADIAEIEQLERQE